MIAVAPGCAPRPPGAPLGHVSEPHAVRVCFRSEPHALRIHFLGGAYPRAATERLVADAREAIESVDRRLVETLRRAGYEVTENGPCDVQVVPQLYLATEARQSRHGHFSLTESDVVRVVLHVSDTTGSEIDRFDFRSIETPERLAVDLVNAMLESPKVASFAEAQRNERTLRP